MPSDGANATEAEGSIYEGLDLNNTDESIVELLQKAQDDYNVTVHSQNEEISSVAKQTKADFQSAIATFNEKVESLSQNTNEDNAAEINTAV